MQPQREVRAPLACRGQVAAASWIVPAGARPQWRARWQRRLTCWWALVEMGELSTRTGGEICRAAWLDALQVRCGGASLERVVRAAWFVPAAGGVLLAAIAVVSRGYPATRYLVDAARGVAAGPARTWGMTGSEDRLVAHSFAAAFAAIVGLIVALIVGLPLRLHNWRYWVFLTLKTLLAAGLVTLAWVEGGPMLRRCLPTQEIRVLGGGLVFTLLYVGGFGYAVAWSVKDQRRRCPVCLRRLAMPVSMGSWASMFDPPTTELFCDAGHGRLCVCEGGGGESERWSALDASWQELFEEPAGPKRPA